MNFEIVKKMDDIYQCEVITVKAPLDAKPENSQINIQQEFFIPSWRNSQKVTMCSHQM